LSVCLEEVSARLSECHVPKNVKRPLDLRAALASSQLENRTSVLQPQKPSSANITGLEKE
jgi:hypothetical protein